MEAKKCEERPQVSENRVERDLRNVAVLNTWFPVALKNFGEKIGASANDQAEKDFTKAVLRKVASKELAVASWCPARIGGASNRSFGIVKLEKKVDRKRLAVN